MCVMREENPYPAIDRSNRICCYICIISLVIANIMGIIIAFLSA